MCLRPANYMGEDLGQTVHGARHVSWDLQGAGRTAATAMLEDVYASLLTRSKEVIGFSSANRREKLASKLGK